jgi:carbon-monoxide dehydrogenase medium subunit
VILLFNLDTRGGVKVKFGYQRPENIGNAVEMLEQYGEKAKIVAGGTDLIIGIKNKKYAPEILVDITLIPELMQTNYEKRFTIGANVTHGIICRMAHIEKEYTALAEACIQLGSPQVRNLATIGGNVCNSSPSAETAPALIALNCRAKITGASGTREIELEKFFKGPSENALESDEILTHLELDQMPPSAGSAYLRLSPRNALDIAIVNVGAYVKLDNNQKIEDVRICLGAVAPTPVRAINAEKILIGEKLTESLLKEAGELSKAHSSPISDVRSSASFRKEMVAVLTERALCKAYERAHKM